jgi:hypothetical protein
MIEGIALGSGITLTPRARAKRDQIRMLAAALLTFAIHDRLLVGDGPSRVPPRERIEMVVQLLMKAIT